eukprot:c19130_g1_i1 orf=143-1636(-)
MGCLFRMASQILPFLVLSIEFYARSFALKAGYGYRILTIVDPAGEETEFPANKGDFIPEQAASWSMEITHRDAKSSPFSTNAASRSEILAERLKRDAARVDAIAVRVELARKDAKNSELKPRQEEASESSSSSSSETLSSPVVSGLSQGSGEYFTRLGIGTPARQIYLVVDTGSDLSWMQCIPCGSCYQESDPIFNPVRSSSFHSVSCSSPLCSELQVHGCQSGRCLYQVSYGDGSFTVGNFAQETLSFRGGGVARGIGIGCGHDNEGLFAGAGGLLGLGGGTLSFPSQVAAITNAQFSYCLADRARAIGGGGSSSLLFGKGAIPAGASFTSLLSNPKLDTFYYVALTGISVGANRLAIAESEFLLHSSGGGGVILDSGTSVTRLISSVYAAMRDAFRAGTKDLPPASAFSLFDTCYNLEGLQSVDVPTVDLHFGREATLKLPASNYLVSIDSKGTYCFAFAPTSGDFSIIGNLQQQGFRISFDRVSSQVGFAEKQC